MVIRSASTAPRLSANPLARDLTSWVRQIQMQAKYALSPWSPIRVGTVWARMVAERRRGRLAAGAWSDPRCAGAGLACARAVFHARVFPSKSAKGLERARAKTLSAGPRWEFF